MQLFKYIHLHCLWVDSKKSFGRGVMYVSCINPTVTGNYCFRLAAAKSGRVYYFVLSFINKQCIPRNIIPTYTSTIQYTIIVYVSGCAYFPTVRHRCRRRRVYNWTQKFAHDWRRCMGGCQLLMGRVHVRLRFTRAPPAFTICLFNLIRAQHRWFCAWLSRCLCVCVC